MVMLQAQSTRGQQTLDAFLNTPKSPATRSSPRRQTTSKAAGGGSSKSQSSGRQCPICFRNFPMSMNTVEFEVHVDECLIASMESPSSTMLEAQQRASEEEWLRQERIRKQEEKEAIELMKQEKIIGSEYYTIKANASLANQECVICFEQFVEGTRCIQQNTKILLISEIS
jgi:hypothetical protein